MAAAGSAALQTRAVSRTVVKAAVGVVVAAALGIAEMGAVDGLVREALGEEAFVVPSTEVEEVSCRKLAVR